MTRSFVPPVAQDDPERAYQALREQAEACTGVSSRDRRIQGIECRHQGVDHRLRVGESDAENGKIVEAILQLGRDIYTIHHVQSDEDRVAPTVLQRTDVYCVLRGEAER
jgi:hypothetical protein